MIRVHPELIQKVKRFFINAFCLSLMVFVPVGLVLPIIMNRIVIFFDISNGLMVELTRFANCAVIAAIISTSVICYAACNSNFRYHWTKPYEE